MAAPGTVTSSLVILTLTLMLHSTAGHAVLDPAYAAVQGHGPYYGLYGPHPLYHAHPLPDGYPPLPGQFGHELYGNTILTCAASVEDESGVNSSVAVNVRPMMHGAVFLGHGATPGLTTTVNVYSKTAPGPVYIALTERTSPGCDVMGHFMGHGLPPHAIYGGPDHAHDVPAYHGPAYHGPAYHGPVYHGPVYHGPAYHGAPYVAAAYHYHALPAPDGVIAQVDITEDKPLSQFRIHQMSNYHVLAGLAGRGVVVCRHDDVVRTFDGHYTCKGTGVSCCTLRYTHKENYLDEQGRLLSV